MIGYTEMILSLVSNSFCASMAYLCSVFISAGARRTPVLTDSEPRSRPVLSPPVSPEAHMAHRSPISVLALQVQLSGDAVHK